MTRPTVLIIDDDQAICEEVGTALERHGFTMRATTEPLDDFLVTGVSPDVIVLDLDMPGVDGFQVIERLGRMARKPQLIVASGHHSRIISAAARGATAAGIAMLGELEKPYSVTALVALLDSYEHKARLPADDVGRAEVMICNGTVYGAARVAFQSKRRIQTEQIIGYESLLRISDGCPINPELFFRPAVEHYVQMALSTIVLDQAMGFARVLHDTGRPLPVAVNCTPAIMCDPTFHEVVQTALDRHQVPPSNLLIELTEHNSLSSLDEVAAAAGRLALRQIGIVIDDFGRGTTSFEKLLDLPLSELKIDKDMFWMATTGEIAPSLLKEVIAFCTGRGIQTTVEGIETEAHRELARDLGADFGQGYLWDRPRFAIDILPL